MDNQSEKKKLVAAFIRILLACMILAACAIYLVAQHKQADKYTQKVIPPTCTESGYTLSTNQLTGSTEILNVVPAYGHNWGADEILRQGTQTEPTLTITKCQRCDETVTSASYPALDIPRLSLEGNMDGIGKKTEVDLTAEFVSEDLQFTAYATAKHQGHSTLQYDKKNYTVKLYKDSDRNEKYKLTLHHWNAENKYILKANYQDPSQAKNLVCADIWAEITKTRASIPARLTETSNYGAVDGFPVALYINHDFQGLYTMNLHKDDDLFAMEEDQHHAIMIINHANGEEAFFKAAAAFDEDTPWEVEFCGTEDASWAKEKLNAFIRFVNESDDTTFQRDLGKHLDIDSAVDYFLAMNVLGLQEHCAKDLILFTYSEEDPWTLSMYDMEEAFDVNGVIPTFTGDSWDSGTGSLLWDRFLNLYYDRICQRYWQLRSSVFTFDNIQSYLKDFTQQIPAQYYLADAAIYGTDAFEFNQTDDMLNSVTHAISTLDTLLQNGGA